MSDFLSLVVSVPTATSAPAAETLAAGQSGPPTADSDFAALLRHNSASLRGLTTAADAVPVAIAPVESSRGGQGLPLSGGKLPSGGPLSASVEGGYQPELTETEIAVESVAVGAVSVALLPSPLVRLPEEPVAVGRSTVPVSFHGNSFVAIDDSGLPPAILKSPIDSGELVPLPDRAAIAPVILVDTASQMKSHFAEAADDTTALTAQGAVSGPASTEAPRLSSGSGKPVQGLPTFSMVSSPDAAEFPGEVTMHLRTVMRQGAQEASLQLHPAELGRVHVSITTEGDQARIAFVADNPAARDALEQSFPRLREMLDQSGLQLAHAEVSTQNPEGGNDRETTSDNAQTVSDVAGLANEEAVHLASTEHTVRLLDCYI